MSIKQSSLFAIMKCKIRLGSQQLRCVMQSPFIYSFGRGTRAAGGVSHPPHIFTCTEAGSNHPKNIFPPCTAYCICSPQCWSRGTPVYAHYDRLSRPLGGYVTIQRWADIVVITHYTHHRPRCRTRTGLLGLLLPLAVPFLRPVQLQNLPSAVTMKLWV